AVIRILDATALPISSDAPDLWRIPQRSRVSCRRRISYAAVPFMLRRLRLRHGQVGGAQGREALRIGATRYGGNLGTRRECVAIFQMRPHRIQRAIGIGQERNMALRERWQSQEGVEMLGVGHAPVA